ncbi:MAG: AgmX/PglI C-terminal domain-containing protein [Myxococcota bacterium]
MAPRLVAIGTGMALLLSVSAARADDAELDVSAVRDRAKTELRCLRAAHARLGKTIELLDDYYEQMRGASNAGVARDAAQAIVSLEKRIRELTGDLRTCMGKAPKEDGRAKVVEAERDPATGAVAEQNPATDVVERDRSLGPYVRIVVGEKVDGTGRVPERSVRNAVTGIARPMQACYERLVERGALEKGELILVFTVPPEGRVRKTRVERSTLGNRAFSRCIERRVRRVLRLDAPAVGGDATYSYTFQLGPR